MNNIKVKDPGFAYLYEELNSEDVQYRDTKHMLRIMTTICYELGVAVPNWIMAQNGMYTNSDYWGCE